MKNKFLKGIFTAAAYYTAGGLLALVAYKTVGQAYTHAPAPHHLMLFVVWLGGCAWALYSIVNRFLGKNVPFNRGAAMANIVVCTAVFLIVYQEINSLDKEHASGQQQDLVTTEFSGDTAIVRQGGKIVFLRIGDSVYFDELSKIYPPDSVFKKP